MNERAHATLLKLAIHLKELGYRFTTVTPESHRHIIERPAAPGSDVLRNFFGWSRLVPKQDLPAQVVELAIAAEILIARGSWVQSAVRFSTLDSMIFVHSAYPTTQADAVFFGPDSYRFVRFLDAKLGSSRAPVVVDLGCGSGVGGISLLAKNRDERKINSLYFTDINALALNYAHINAELNRVESFSVLESDLFQKVPPGADLVIANPPFIMDDLLRPYRHGGGAFGTGLSVRIVQSALEYLKPGGRLMLYTGTCVVNGEDQLLQQIRPLMTELEYSYEEIDPDIFGDELSHPSYKEVERIAAVGLVVQTGFLK
jgi:methylase of polypeptide subunit release factors